MGCKTSGRSCRRDRKIAFVDQLTAAGHSAIEVTAFVSPKWVPQMGDAAEVFRGIARKPGVRYSALVPNRAGLDRAMAAGVTEIAIFAAASETFSRRNINQSIDESFVTYRQVTDAAAQAALRIRAYLSTSFGCPFEGSVDPQRVAQLAERLLALGAYEVAVSDTIGIAHPGQVGRCSTCCLRACRWRTRAALSRHARHGAGQRARGP